MLKKIHITLVAFLMTFFLYNASAHAKTGTPEILHYTDIPGITQEEIAAIRSVAEKKSVITYGSLLSTEIFTDEHGNLNGYTQRLCTLFSSLFGIQFVPALYDWDDLLAGLADGTIDFSGDLIPTPQRHDKYFMSKAIAERAINIFTKKGAESIKDIAKTRLPKLAFLSGSVHLAPFQEMYSTPFELVYAHNFEEALAMVLNQSVDAFINESVSDCFLVGQSLIESKPLFPLIYIPVSLTTQQQELKAFISAVDKYLAHGGQAKLAQLYALGETDYKKYALYKAFTAEDLAYIQQNLQTNRHIPVALESDNYPISFYNYKTNRFEGIVVDMLAAITEATGLRFTVHNKGGTPWEELLASLTSGEVHLVSELMYSEARKDKYLWTEQPFCTTSFAFISRLSYPDLEIYQVMSQKVGVIKGTAYEEVYNKWFPTNKAKVYDTADLAFEGLERNEITLIMAAESLLLSQTNYREKPGFKVNIPLDHPIDVKLGFNLHEKELCSVISKTQDFIKTDVIAKRWFGKIFDYSAELSKTRVYLLLICTVLLLVVIGFIASLLFRNRMSHKKLEKIVNKRTQQLQKQIREREAAELEARIASSAKSSFLAKMSHEIRTPLNGVIGMAEIARKTITDNPKATSAIERILASSHHLLAILNDILDMAKIESGKMELDNKPFNLEKAITEISNIILDRCVEKNITLSMHIDPIRDRVVIGDRLRLNQVLLNLLGNAVKFTPKHGRISISVSVLEETQATLQLCFTVQDNGIGMSPEQIAKLFVPFEQADASIASRFGGTGLGLSICKNMIQSMGGEISVASTPGVETTFTFQLVMQKGQALPEESPEALEEVVLSDKRILLAEDIDINQIIVEEQLAPTGVHLDIAKNGSEAVAMFSDSPQGYYHLIFMDIQMPVMNGYEATLQIRALARPDAKQIPIIAMTANAYQEDVDQAMAAGMNGHLPKPLNTVSLFKILKCYLVGR